MYGFFVKKILRNTYLCIQKNEILQNLGKNLLTKNSNYKNHRTMIKFYTLRIFHQNFFAKSFYKMPQKFYKNSKNLFWQKQIYSLKYDISCKKYNSKY